jgi:hypothetical protein
MATRTQKLGIGGIVVDGRVRDLQYIRSLELPVDSPDVLWSGDLIIGFCQGRLDRRCGGRMPCEVRLFRISVSYL